MSIFFLCVALACRWPLGFPIFPNPHLPPRSSAPLLNTLFKTGCYAKASRALGVVFEPAVSINITDVKQGCMPSAAGAVAYKVSVDYMGAKKEAASALAGCVKSSGALGVLGNGTLVWKCTFASADAAANVTLNFTAAGLIDGEARSASLALPATKIAVQPTVEITKLPTQASLLKFNDTASKVNFTVSAKFAGATAGLWKSEPKCVTAGNASAVRDATVTLDFVCSFDNSRQVPETFKFRSLTAADGACVFGVVLCC